jgi:hypothetical protein
MGQLIVNAPTTFAFSFPTPRELIRRMLAMAALWLLFGMVAGCILMPDSVISLLSGAIAGAIVLPWLGLILGMLGGTVRQSLVGGLTGLLVAMFAAILSGSGFQPYNLDLCLIIGGIVGANFSLLTMMWVRLRQLRRASRA